MLYFFLVGRVLLGGYFLMNGYNHFKHIANMTGYAKSKGVMMPKESVMATGAMMLLGGAGILLGVFTNIAIILLVIFLVGTLLKMHRYWEVSDPMAQMGERINFYKNLALIGALLMITMVPTPWVLSLF